MSYISVLHLTSKNKHDFSCERKLVILRWRERVGGERESEKYMTCFGEICKCAYSNVGGRYVHTDPGLLTAHFSVKLI
jgi:hypothetical protein